MENEKTSNSSMIKVAFTILVFIMLGVIYWYFYKKISLNWKWYWDIVTVCAICTAFSFIGKLIGSPIKGIIVSNFGLASFALFFWYFAHMPLKWYWDVLILLLLFYYFIHFITWGLTGKKPLKPKISLGGKSLREGEKCPHCNNGQMNAFYDNKEKKKYLICLSCGYRERNY